MFLQKLWLVSNHHLSDLYKTKVNNTCCKKMRRAGQGQWLFSNIIYYLAWWMAMHFRVYNLVIPFLKSLKIIFQELPHKGLKEVIDPNLSVWQYSLRDTIHFRHSSMHSLLWKLKKKRGGGGAGWISPNEKFTYRRHKAFF